MANAPEGLDYGPPRDDAELAAYRDILERCFNVERERSGKWMEKAGHDKLRVLRQRGRVMAGLLFVEMGQHFGGRRVPTWGVAAVGVPPESRGGGMATGLMRCAVREVRAAGQPISTLYPATYPLYRRAGYENAGSLMRYILPTSLLAGMRSELAVRPVEEADYPRIEAAYEEQASRRPGYLSRGPYVWNRVRRVDGEPAEGYLVEDSSNLRGYVFLQRLKREPLGYDLGILDLVALDAEAGRRLLALLGAHRSMAPEISWRQGPGGPFVSLLPERSFRLELDNFWMLRLCDLHGAMRARGFAECLTAELHLDVQDSDIPENSGAHILRVADGVGRIEAGGRAELTLPIGSLAALYSGFQNAESLAAAGRLSGSREAQALATALFAGEAPGMADMF